MGTRLAGLLLLVLSLAALPAAALPEEIAQAVVYLAVHGDYITGQQLSINGGMYM